MPVQRALVKSQGHSTRLAIRPRPKATADDAHPQLAPSTHQRDYGFMAPETIRGSQTNCGRQSLARMALDTRSRSQNNRLIDRLQAVGPSRCCAQATTMGAVHLANSR